MRPATAREMCWQTQDLDSPSSITITTLVLPQPRIRPHDWQRGNGYSLLIRTLSSVEILSRKRLSAGTWIQKLARFAASFYGGTLAKIQNLPKSSTQLGFISCPTCDILIAGPVSRTMGNLNKWSTSLAQPGQPAFTVGAWLTMSR